MTPLVLTINGGSSSLKFAVFGADTPPRRLLSGAVDRIGLAGSTLTVTDAAGRAAERRTVSAPDHAGCVPIVCEAVDKRTGFDGIGENAPVIRSRVAEGLDFLGISLDSARNAASEGRISPDGAPVTVLVIPTDEEREIADAVCTALRSTGP
jgi:acetate kinase